MERNQFTFYLSFAKAIRRIKDPTDRALAYDTLVNYALNGEKPDMDALPDSVSVVFEMAAPILDSSRKKARAGQASGNKRRTNANKARTNANTAGTNANQGQEQEQVKEQEEEQEQGKDKEQMFILSSPPYGVEDNKTAATSKAADTYMAKINPTPSPASMQELLDYERELGTDVCLRAIDAALDAGARSWNYVRSVLQAKKIQGIRSAEDWDRQEADRMDAKARKVRKQAALAEPAGVDYGDIDRLYDEIRGRTGT